MEEFKLSDDVIEQIKNFNYWSLTDEQRFLIDKLILNEELKERYKKNGLCKDSKVGREMVEWIEYDRFENVEYLAKGGFGTIYKAIWKDGCICEWDSINDQWERIDSLAGHKNFPVVLKCLHNSQDMTSEFLREIESHTMIVSSRVTHCYGITKDPESNNFMMVIQYAKDANELSNLLYKLYDSSKFMSVHEINKQIEEAERINEKFTSTSLPYNGTTLSYTTNPQAVYTSRLLNFKNLPEPKNAIDNKDDDNSFGEYSESIEAIDFTKLNLDENN
ncbi:uncharacterized protein OCT59_015166 [Rhizophagus irregularis]|uniref:uncharacterized protein n=1 Tax=Rhizophagus irregularis TaxID=588596 RepID=UPI003322BB97|nr:hypothetical protein OCT59_015166 [Rhizophagus irregularis]